MWRAFRQFALAAAIAPLLAGCGGSDGARAEPSEKAAVPAIEGTLTYRLADGTAQRLAEPVHGTCVPFESAAVSVANATDATAHLRDGCGGPEGDVVVPGATWTTGNGPPATAVVMLRH